MAQPKPERISFDQVVEMVDQLTPNERRQLRQRLEFQSSDDEWNNLKHNLAQKRSDRGLPPPSDEDIQEEIDARRTPEELDVLRREIQIGLTQLDEGRSVPAEQVLAKLKARADKRLEDWKANQ